MKKIIAIILLFILGITGYSMYSYCIYIRNITDMPIFDVRSHIDYFYVDSLRLPVQSELSSYVQINGSFEIRSVLPDINVNTKIDSVNDKIIIYDKLSRNNDLLIHDELDFFSWIFKKGNPVIFEVDIKSKPAYFKQPMFYPKLGPAQYDSLMSSLSILIYDLKVKYYKNAFRLEVGKNGGLFLEGIDNFLIICERQSNNYFAAELVGVHPDLDLELFIDEINALHLDKLNIEKIVIPLKLGFKERHYFIDKPL